MKIFKLLPLGLALGMAYICYATKPDTFNSNTDQTFKPDNSFQENHQENYTQQLNKLIDAVQAPDSLLGKSLSEKQMNEFVKLIKEALSFENIKEIVKEVLEIKEDLLEEIPEILSAKNIEKTKTMISNIKETLINQINNAAEEATETVTEIITEYKDPLINTISSINEDKIYKGIECGIDHIINGPLSNSDSDFRYLLKQIALSVEAFQATKPEKYLKNGKDVALFTFIVLEKTLRKTLKKAEELIISENEDFCFRKKAVEVDTLSLRLSHLIYASILILLDA